MSSNQNELANLNHNIESHGRIVGEGLNKLCQTVVETSAHSNEVKANLANKLTTLTETKSKHFEQALKDAAVEINKGISAHAIENHKSLSMTTDGIREALSTKTSTIKSGLLDFQRSNEKGLLNLQRSNEKGFNTIAQALRNLRIEGNNTSIDSTPTSREVDEHGENEKLIIALNKIAQSINSIKLTNSTPSYESRENDNLKKTSDVLMTMIKGYHQSLQDITAVLKNLAQNDEREDYHQYLKIIASALKNFALNENRERANREKKFMLDRVKDEVVKVCGKLDDQKNVQSPFAFFAYYVRLKMAMRGMECREFFTRFEKGDYGTCADIVEYVMKESIGRTNDALVVLDITQDHEDETGEEINAAKLMDGLRDRYKGPKYKKTAYEAFRNVVYQERKSINRDYFTAINVVLMTMKWHHCDYPGHEILASLRPGVMSLGRGTKAKLNEIPTIKEFKEWVIKREAMQRRVSIQPFNQNPLSYTKFC